VPNDYQDITLGSQTQKILLRTNGSNMQSRKDCM